MTEISEITDHVSAQDGTRLFFRQYPIENERAGVLIVHGLGEHSGRYYRLAKNLASNGLQVFSYDHRGHGQSEGKRGHITTFGEYIDDLEIMIEKSRIAIAGKSPLFLLGHSMGGLIVLNYARNNPGKIDGVIASSPGLAPAVEPPAVKIAAAKVLSVLMPSFSFDNELDPQFLSHDKTVVDAYVNDPLVHTRITARWGIEFMKAGEQTLKDAHLLKIPVLMQVAGDDHLTKPETSTTFFQNMSSKDKTLRFYDTLYHEIYNEKEDLRKPVIDDLDSWLKDHI